MTRNDDVPRASLLLVCDRPEEVPPLRAALGPLGRPLTEAPSAEAALPLLAADDFAAILLDLRDDPGAVAAARRVREAERSRHTPVLFLVGPDFPLGGAYALGAVDHLARPPAPDVLRAKVALLSGLSPAGSGEARRQAEAERRRDLVCRVLEHAPVAVAVSEGPEHRIVYLNRLAAAVAGLPPGEFVGRTVAEVVPEAAREVGAVLDRVYQTGRSEVVPELAVTLPGGRVVPLQMTYAPLPGPEGRPAGVLHLGVDLSERRRAEERTEAERARLEAVLRQLPAGVLIAEAPSGRVVLENERAREILRTPTADPADRWELDRRQGFHPDGRPYRADEWPLARALRRGEVVTGEEIDFLRGDGTRGTLRVSAAPIRGRDGRVAAGLAVYDDITERKEMEQELRRRAERLAEHDRRRSEFLAVLAHELRNPLAPLLTSVHVLRQADAAPAARAESLDRLERQVRHLSRLVDDLVDVDRTARGAVPLRTERLDLARLARAAAGDRREALEGAGLALELQTPETPVWVRGDPTRLTQVLNNLLDNAAKFSRPGGRVTVRLAAGEGGREAALTVRDEGVGIDPADLPRLFEVFAQGAQERERRRGLGLGLSLVKGLVELHGGSVGAASAGPGRGAEFTVRLPAEAEPAALAAPPAAPGEGGERARVLIVEDNRDAADSLREVLELFGHEVRVAYTGADGVQEAAAYRPDAVVSDIGLPGLDGFEVARRIRGTPGLGGVLLVALTGYNTEDDRRRGREAGFNHYFGKPADPLDLLKVLKSPAG